MSGKYVKKFAVLLVMAILSGSAMAVTTRVINQSSPSDFAGGKTENVVITSQGQINLGPAYQALAEKMPQAWTVNAVIASHNAVYAGTSPNGCIYKFSNDALIKIYPPEPIKAADANSLKDVNSAGKPADTNVPQDANIAKDANAVKDANSARKNRQSAQSGYLTNEHVFALGLDSVGRVLAGISGEKCRLVRLEGENAETIFEPNDSNYIFALATDDFGNIYVATGPKGNVYKLDPFGQKPELIYHASDKNILSLAVGVDGFVYAGADGRGVIYRIDPVTKTASVLYDSEQNEITAIVLDGRGTVYAAATTPSLSKPEAGIGLQNMPGRRDIEPKAGQTPNKPAPQVQITNTDRKLTEEDQARLKAAFSKSPAPNMPSHIYRITPDGFVTDIFQDNAIFLSLVLRNDQLMIGTGNKGQLYGLDTQSEEKQILYKDEQASQISSLYGADANTIYIGTSNPPKLVKLSSRQAVKGTYTSDLIDAEQPAKWGKLQLEGVIPPGTAVQVSARSSNIGDINDPAFSAWSKPVDYNQPVQLEVPTGRFLQYQLIFAGSENQSPAVRQVMVPFVVPNLAPQVQMIAIARSEEKPGLFNIGYKTLDRNRDKLIYRLDIRKAGRTNWIKIKDELETDTYLWDSRTVEDGRYEIRVTASDSRSNNADSALSDSRISEQFVVDNTGPSVVASHIDVKDKQAVFTATVEDNLSVFASVSYTVDSGINWITTLPADSVFDTTREELKIKLDDLEAGQHVLAIKMTDAAGNTSYKTFDFDVK